MYFYLSGVLYKDDSKCFKTFPKRQILDSSKLKGLADDNVKFDEIGGKFCRRVDNIVGKGKIACYIIQAVFSSTGQRPASFCHGVVSFVRACVRP